MFRRLSPPGLRSFETWLGQLRQDGRISPPKELLSNPHTSEELGFEFEPASRHFGTRAELGSWLARNLEQHAGSILYDEGFWSALALHLFDEICAPRTNGVRTPGESARYLFDSKRKAYRHLIWAAWWAMRTYGEDGQYLLVPSNLGQHPLEFGGGELMGQIAANQMTAGSAAVIRLGRRLYADPITGHQRKGSSGKGASSPRRFIQVLRQFELTYDFSSMTDANLAKLLPAEFASRLA
jgi:hypothetical protein